jgi:hypothetical protein
MGLSLAFLQSLLLGGFQNSIPLPWKVLLEPVSKVHDSMMYKAKNKEGKRNDGRKRKRDTQS